MYRLIRFYNPLKLLNKYIKLIDFEALILISFTNSSHCRWCGELTQLYKYKYGRVIYDITKGRSIASLKIMPMCNECYERPYMHGFRPRVSFTHLLNDWNGPGVIWRSKDHDLIDRFKKYQNEFDMRRRYSCQEFIIY